MKYWNIKKEPKRKLLPGEPDLSKCKSYQCNFYMDPDDWDCDEKECELGECKYLKQP